MERQRIGFTNTADGVRIAFAVGGRGFPLVKAANWLSHLEYDWNSPVWHHWLTELARGRALVRYDERGTGLSDRELEDLSFEALVDDLERVVDSLSLGRFDLLGMSQGGAISIAYAVRHPERVRRIVLYGAYAQGRLARAATQEEQDEADLLVAITRHGWGTPNPALRRVFATLFWPDAQPALYEAFDELQRVSATADVAARLRRTLNSIDVRELATQIAIPTLVIHSRGDGIAPFEQGRLLAALIPGARLVPLESRHYLLLAGEPAWADFLAEFRSFLAPEPTDVHIAAPGYEAAGLPRLSARELEVLALVADGRSNVEIADGLALSVRTVERHLSNVYLKLGVEGKAARAAAAARLARGRA
jgi:pimeloyl-ACP methyl ester carboxylesterase/DNA-binding CsgD family transcriptional regulator